MSKKNLNPNQRKEFTAHISPKNSVFKYKQEKYSNENTPLHRVNRIGVPFHKIIVTIKSMEGSEQTIAYDYNNRTKVQDFIKYLEDLLEKHNFYLKSGNMHIDYFFTLPKRFIRELTVSKLRLEVIPIKIPQKISMKACQILKCIGMGGFSKVFLARVYGKIMALKLIEKQFILRSPKQQSVIENQRMILEASTGHPFITKLYLAFETSRYVVFAMEYCNGGELFNLLKKVKKMREDEARFYFLQTLSALRFLHSKGIVYRDLKPENIILDSDGHVRLADFGLSKFIHDETTYSFCGSAEYMSPEMLLKKGHSYEVDYYCLGALLYELITGLPPYYSHDQSELFESILAGNLTFPPHLSISNDLKYFFQKILQKQVSNRFQSFEEIVSHPWVSKSYNKRAILSKQLDPPFKTNMFTYNFDDSEYANEEGQIIRVIQSEKNIQTFERSFHFIDYVSPELPHHRNQSPQLNKFAKKSLQQIERNHLFVNKSRNTPRRKQLFSEKKKIDSHYFPSSKPSQTPTKNNSLNNSLQHSLKFIKSPNKSPNLHNSNEKQYLFNTIDKKYYKSSSVGKNSDKNFRFTHKPKKNSDNRYLKSLNISKANLLDFHNNEQFQDRISSNNSVNPHLKKKMKKLVRKNEEKKTHVF